MSFQKFYRLVDFSSSTGCSEDAFVDANLSQAVVTVMRGDCSFSVKASVVAKLGAVAIINISPSNESLVSSQCFYIPCERFIFASFAVCMGGSECPIGRLLADSPASATSVHILPLLLSCILYLNKILQCLSLSGCKQVRQSSLHNDSVIVGK